MTEEEWYRSHDFTRVLKCVRRMINAGQTKAGRRKLRLIGCACCRATFRGTNPRADINSAYWQAMETAEAFADGLVESDALSATIRTLNNLSRGSRPSDPDDRNHLATLAIRHAVSYSPVDAARLAGWFCIRTQRHDPKGGRELQKLVCDLARDVFGNLFRPVVFLDAWRTSTTAGVAQAIYDEHAFDRLPILADALQDAGCEEVAVLDHCHGGIHDRGCWVVDAVLRKG